MFTIYYKFVLQEMRKKVSLPVKDGRKKNDTNLTALSYSIKSKDF